MVRISDTRYYPPEDVGPIEVHDRLDNIHFYTDAEPGYVTVCVCTTPESDDGYGFEGEITPAEARQLVEQLLTAISHAENP